MKERRILLNSKKVNDVVTIDDLSENDILKIMNIYFINGSPVRDDTGKWVLVDKMDDLDESNYNFDILSDNEIL